MRISWSLLKAWSGKNYQMVEDILFRLPSFQSEAMKKGSDVHEYIAENKLDVLDFYTEQTLYEKKFVIPHGEDTFVCILDTYDPEQKFMVDYKVSKSSANSQDKRQLYMYNYLLGLAGEPTCEKGYMVQLKPDNDIEDVEVLSIAEYNISNTEEIEKWIEKNVEELKLYVKETYGIQA